MSNLDLTQDELVEAKTHINLIQKSYRKLESAQYAVRELEGDFRYLITLHIQQKGGDPELQYNLNTDTGSLEPVQQDQLEEGSQNGNMPSEESLDPSGNFQFGEDEAEEV